MPTPQKKVTPIRLYGDPVLRKKAEPVRNIDAQLRALIESMVSALGEARGLGLAAPQLGCSKSLCIINLPALDESQTKPLVLINPVVGLKEGKSVHDEGCLSFPGIYVEVARPRKIGLRGLDQDGNEIEIEAEEMLARVFLHEIDHLNGVLFIDHLSAIKRQLLKRQLKDLGKDSGRDGD
jgi:peptide deformylase